MDFIYDDKSMDLSLQSLTTTIIIQNILEDEGMLPNCMINQKTISSRAIKVVNNLPLSLLLKWQLRSMVLPIMEKMQSWYQYKNEGTRIALTQNGTVDVPKSIRAVLNNENVSLKQRFQVACDHCLEQEIFDTGAQINFPHNFGRLQPDPIWRYHTKSLDKIWYNIYEGNFHAKLGFKDISKDYCTQGFVQALYMGNSAGVKYFEEGASLSEISEHIRFNINSIVSKRSFTPNMGIKIFKKLNVDEGQWLKSRFSAQLLTALLQWPYQHQFLKAAESLAKNMDSEPFGQVAVSIVAKARVGWEDHDYKGLFINFWKLGSEPKTSYIQPVGYAMDRLYNVILMRDKRLAHFVLDNTTEEFKTQHLFHCDDSSVCLSLIFGKHFQALELFMEVCRVNNDKLIVEFQKDILEYFDHGVIRYSYFSIFGYLNINELKNILREFLSRMDKTIQNRPKSL